MKKVYSFLSMVASGIAAAMTGTSMAVTAGTYGGDTDPNSGTTLEKAVKTKPENKGGIAQHGQMSSGDKLQEAGLIDNKLFERVIEYHAKRYPFYTAMFNKATQYAFRGHKEAEYPEVGDIKTEAVMKAQGPAKGTTATLTSSHLHANDIAIFRPNYTVFVLSDTIRGYDEAGTSATNAPLELVVVSNDSNGLVLRPVNGPIESGAMKVPQLPSGTTLKLGAPALAEEEVEVDPINVIPTTRKAYLQKKGYSVAITNFFDESVKEVDWERDKIKRQALDAYKKLYTTTALFGTKSKFYKTNKNGVRLVYTQDGLMNQIQMAYQLPSGKWTKGDLIAISKLLFTAYTDATEVDIFCGSDAIESLLNIDWGTDTSKILYVQDEDYKVKIATFESSFGTLKFTHEMSLTENHLEKAAIAIPMADCMRVYRDNGSTKKVDGNKGETGAVEELTKEFFIQDDCLVCNSMCSMLIGPASVFSGTGNIQETFIAVATLPTSYVSGMTTGDLYYLTAVDGTNARGLYKLTVGGSSGSETVSFSPYVRDI